MMNRITSLAALLLVVLLVGTASSFTTVNSQSKVMVGTRRVQEVHSVATSSLMSSSTALQLRVEQSDDDDSDRLNPAVFKNALYLGSVAFAVLLPLFFVVAGALKN